MISKTAKVFCVVTILMSVISVTASESDVSLWKAPKKKLIEFGWDIPDPAYIKQNIDAMEKNSPYDGIGIKLDVKARQDGKEVTCSRTTIFQNVKWQKEWFKPLVDDLKNIKFRKFTDNFIVLTTCPGNIDWFDDKSWESVCNNFSVMGWASKESGCKGILLDIEQYGKNRIFRFDPESRHSFAETWAKARERGAQFIKAMTKEYPDMTLFTFFWLDLNYKVSNSPDVANALESQDYGLTVPFINGIYDALPATVKIVEGHEEGGYYAKTPYDYLTLKESFIPLSKPLLAPENINKFLSQTSFAVATFLDCYINNSGSWVVKSKEMTRLDLLRRNIRLALKYSDEYSWTWGEQCKWWPIKIEDWKEKKSAELPGAGKLWKDALSGIKEAMEQGVLYARDPMAYALAELKAGRLKNYIKNPGFEGSAAPAGNITPPADCIANNELCDWQTWQRTKDQRPDRNSSGTFTLDKDTGCETPCAAKLAAVKDGSILQSVPVKPGESYLVMASSRQKGNTPSMMAVKWRSSDMRWTAKHMDVRDSFKEALQNGWKRASFIVTVPEEVSYMTVVFETESQGTPDCICHLDDVQAYKLFE